MEQLIGTSRIALLGANHEIVLYGSWVTKDASYPGCSFSNSGYETPKPIPATRDYWKNLDADDGYSNDSFYSDFPSVRTPAKTPATPITKITAEYWEEYDKWFRKFPNGTYVEFNRYYVNVSKRKAEKTKKKTSSKEVKTSSPNVTTQKPFWGSIGTSGYRPTDAGIEKLPSGTLVKLAYKEEVNVYYPPVDGELYCEDRAKFYNERTFLYVKKETKSGIKYFFIGAAMVVFPAKEDSTNENKSLIAQ
jgi:hypothetical protein